MTTAQIEFTPVGPSALDRLLSRGRIRGVLASVSLPDTELAIVISRPSRIQAVPSPSTSRVWNGDHLSRSSRAGIVLRTGCCRCLAATLVIAGFPSHPADSLRAALVTANHKNM